MRCLNQLDQLDQFVCATRCPFTLSLRANIFMSPSKWVANEELSRSANIIESIVLGQYYWPNSPTSSPISSLVNRRARVVHQTKFTTLRMCCPSIVCRVSKISKIIFSRRNDLQNWLSSNVNLTLSSLKFVIDFNVIFCQFIYWKFYGEKKLLLNKCKR